MFPPVILWPLCYLDYKFVVISCFSADLRLSVRSPRHSRHCFVEDILQLVAYLWSLWNVHVPVLVSNCHFCISVMFYGHLFVFSLCPFSSVYFMVGCSSLCIRHSAYSFLYLCVVLKISGPWWSKVSPLVVLHLSCALNKSALSQLSV